MKANWIRSVGIRSVGIRSVGIRSIGIRSIGLSGAIGAVVIGSTAIASEPTVSTLEAPRATTQLVGELPRPVTSFGSAVADGWVYVLGGYFGTPHDYVTAKQSRYFYRIATVDPTRVELLPNEERLQSVALVAHDGGIVRLGGMTIVDDVMSSVDRCQRFDPKSEAWTDLPSLPSPRSSHEATLIGDVVYLVGGWNIDPHQGAKPWHQEVWSLDLSDPSATWQSYAQPFQRRALDVVTVDGKVVAIGGMTSTGEISGAVDLFDPASGEWSRGPDFPAFGFGVSAVVLEDRIFASGMDGVIWTWTPGDTTWAEVGSLAFPRFFHQLVPVSDDEFMALGGIGEDVRTRHVERVRVTKGGLAPAANDAITHWRIPYSGSARNRAATFLAGTSLYLFGGNNSPEQHDFDADNFVSEGWRLDVSAMSIERVADFPAARQSMQTVMSGSGRYAVAVGGFGHDGEVARTFGDVYRFEPKKGTWTELGSLPAPRSQFGVSRQGRYLWVFGGLDYDPTRPRGEQFRHLSSVLRWKIGTDAEFETMPVAMTTPRRAFAAATLGERYFVIGGMREEFELVESAEVFDFEAQTWSTIRAPSRSRLSAELVTLDGRLFLVGGLSPAVDGELVPNQTIEMYDPAFDTWSVVVDSLPIDVRDARAFGLGGELLILSTQVEAGVLDLLRVAVPSPLVGG